MSKHGILAGRRLPAAEDGRRAPAVRFALSNVWDPLGGCGFGVPQSLLRGTVAVHVPAGLDLGPLQRWMEDALLAPLPDPGPKAGAARALAHGAMHWALALQRRSGIPLASTIFLERSDTRTADGVVQEVFSVALPSAHAQASRIALAWVQRAVRGALADHVLGAVLANDLEAAAKELARFAESDQNRVYVVQHALDSGIPVHALVRGVHRLGTGRFARFLKSSITDRTPNIGVQLARDKMATAEVLAQAGLPAPEHQRAPDAGEAVRIARRMGYPVVVKPADLDQGLGVHADLRDDESVAKAFEAARALSERILVERHFEGTGHRLTVFEGRVVKATRKLPGGVTGDGRRTVEALVQAAREEAMGDARRTHRVLLALDEEALGMLAQQGLGPASVLEEGRFVSLRRRNNAIAGGSTTTLDLASVHPDNLRLAVRAAQALRLDWAGIDLLIADIGRSWLESGALVCEVNAQPQMGTADTPTIYQELLAEMVPDGGRIPIHLALCAGVAIAPADAIAEVQQREPCSLVAHAGGLWMDGTRIARGFGSGFDALRAALELPEAREILCAMTAEEVVRLGLPIDRIDRLTIVGTPDDADAGRGMLERAVAILGGHFRKTQRI